MNLPEIQEELRRQNIDGWLFFDHHQRDPLAYRILGLAPARHVTRRWYYFIPANGAPLGLVHRIEAGMIEGLPGDRLEYSSWDEQINGLRRLLNGARRVAMQYSPDCAIPYVSMVDGGTLDLVRHQGVDVVSSAELVQRFEVRLDAAGLESHLQAGKLIDRIRAQAFELIAERLRNGVSIDEFSVSEYIRERFRAESLLTESGPIVGVNANAGNPHYEPAPVNSLTMRRGDFVLLDMWAKLDRPDAVYYDITWTGFCGAAPPERFVTVFDVVKTARDRAIDKVQTSIANGETVRGFEVDNAARRYIDERGYGRHFTHRTGHSIGRDVHGNGANMDDLETHDDRKLMPWSCFSIEPGVYLDDFGVRSEINIFIDDKSARVTGEIQQALVLIE